MLCARIAREIHVPVTYVMQLPFTELRIWAAVFKYENDIENAPDVDENEEINPDEIYKLIGGEIRK